MRFLMVTTFFGAESFGGDSVYVERLCEALIRRGHEVHVVYDRDAYRLTQGNVSPRPYTPPEELRVHPLSSPVRSLSPLWTHATGSPGSKWPAIRSLLEKHAFDVVHFHDISLIGGPALITKVRAATKARILMTAHDYWLACPMSLLWKYDRAACDKPSCASCCLVNGRSPQFWRAFGGIDRGLRAVDVLIFPSRYSMDAHGLRGVRHPRVACLPYFLTPEWIPDPDDAPASTVIWRQPYFLAAGRIIRAKGYHTLLSAMNELPECNLRIAGDGPFLPELRRLAGDAMNVEFIGMQSAPGLRRLYSNAAALIVPSLFEETFSYVAIEAFACGRPVIAREIGALREVVEAGGGLLYRTDDELVPALRTIAANSRLRRQMGEAGRRASHQFWSEDTHLRRYLELAHS